MKKKNTKGFTLIELLVVIAIIGIIAVVAIPKLFESINKAKAADLLKDYETIKYGVLQNYSDNNEFANTNRPGVISTHGYLSDQKKIEKNFEHKIDKSPFGGRYYIEKNDKQNTVKVTIQPQNKEEYKAMNTIKNYKNYIEKHSNGAIQVNADTGYLTMNIIG